MVDTVQFAAALASNATAVGRNPDSANGLWPTQIPLLGGPTFDLNGIPTASRLSPGVNDLQMVNAGSLNYNALATGEAIGATEVDAFIVIPFILPPYYVAGETVTVNIKGKWMGIGDADPGAGLYGDNLQTYPALGFQNHCSPTPDFLAFGGDGVVFDQDFVHPGQLTGHTAVDLQPNDYVTILFEAYLKETGAAQSIFAWVTSVTVR